jgi:hypothetical protein
LLEGLGGLENDGKNRGSAGHLANPGVATGAAERDVSSHPAGPRTAKNFLSEVAWDTDVWLAEMPDHLIHYNGDRFLGPRG